MRAVTPDSVKPNSLLHSEAQSVLPWNVYILVESLLWACCCQVAHRIFSGEYGPSGSGYLSRVCAFEGLGPTSLRKAVKSFLHLSQTLIPRPPYLGQLLCFGLEHLSIMPAHMKYSVVLVAKCVRLLHPQLIDFPRLRLLMATSFSRPHLHRHSQYLSPFLVGAAPVTVQ